MIDEKEIEEAQDEIFEDKFLLNGEEIEFDNDAKEEMFYKEDIKEAIKLGANWAIEQFLKDLWHPTREEPEEGRNILIEQKCNNIHSNFHHYNVEEYDSYYDDPWDVKVRILNITHWLYIDDLFPKEGGEK